MASTFRPRNDKVEDRFEELQAECQNVTGKHGANATLNFAVNIAHAYIQTLNNDIQELKQEKIKAGDAIE